METAKRWQVDKHKVGSICLNPANPRYAITAHLKRYIRLWDLEKIATLPIGLQETETMSKAMVLQYEHQKACSSAVSNLVLRVRAPGLELTSLDVNWTVL